jgi:hypothetical protein
MAFLFFSRLFIVIWQDFSMENLRYSIYFRNFAAERYKVSSKNSHRKY